MAKSIIPIQAPLFRKSDIEDPDLQFLNQWATQITSAANLAAGAVGPSVLPAGIDMAGGSVTGLGNPTGETDAVPLGHANSQFGYAAQQGQLDIGKPYALKGLTGLWLKFNQLSATLAAGGTITQYANLAGSRGFYATANPDTTPPASPYIYQNKSGGIMFVVATADGGGGGFHGRAYCDSSAAPTTPVSEFSRVNAGSSAPNYYPGPCWFIVAPGFYYGISVTSGGGTPGSPRVWTEWVLAGSSGGGGGGGGGISQLTGDVQAGPGSGSVSSTVVRVNSGSIPISQAYIGTNASGQIIAASTPGTVPNFADDETVSGSGTSWTLANSPAAGSVPQLYIEVASFGLVGLLKGSAASYGYTISGTAVTTISSYSAGIMHAWYRY